MDLLCIKLFFVVVLGSICDIYYEGGLVERCGLQIYDKILQVSYLIDLGNFCQVVIKL